MATPPEDNIIEQLQGLSAEAQAQLAVMKKSRDQLSQPGAVEMLATFLEDTLSLLVDIADKSYRAHVEHYEWGAQVDDDLDELKENLEAGSQLLPSDALRLKLLFGALLPVVADGGLQKQITEAVAFIDEITMDEEAPGRETEEDDAEEVDEKEE